MSMIIRVSWYVKVGRDHHHPQFYHCCWKLIITHVFELEIVPFYGQYLYTWLWGEREIRDNEMCM